jgi:hypothetical protein
MNKRSQMQGGKNWILPKERKMQTGSSETLIGWKSGKTNYPTFLYGTEWRSVATDSEVCIIMLLPSADTFTSFP